MATIQVRVDDALKAQADALFAGLGMDTSTAIRVFLKQSLRRGGIPFPVTGTDAYQAYVERALDEADAEARSTERRLTRVELMAEARARIHGV